MISIVKQLIVLILAASLYAVAEEKKDIKYGEADNVPLLMDAYILDGPGPFPTIVYVHGGGFTGGDKKGLPKPLYELLSQKGFNWFSVNYRLAPKYPFPAETDDVESSLMYIRAHAKEYKVDLRRMALMGGSAGGHLVSFVGAKYWPQNHLAAVLPFFGEHDLVQRTQLKTDCVMDGHTRHTDEPEPCISPGLKAFLGVNDLSPESMKIIRAASPATYIKKKMPAYLLVHGDSDHYVPYDQSVLMLNEMKKAGARVELYTVTGGGHGDWDNDPAKSEYKEAVLTWLQKTLKL